jgi:tetratricopeptide (TPR) repeat protein
LSEARTDSAEIAYLQALELDPSFWIARLNRAEAAFCRGDTEAAIAIIEELLADFGSNPASRTTTHAVHIMGLAFYYLELGRVAEVRRLCEASLAAQPRIATEADYCQLLLIMGEPHEVLARIRAARQRWPQPQVDDLLLYEGLAYVALDSVDRASAVAAQVREQYDTYGADQFAYHYLAAALALAQGDAAEALRFLEQAKAYGIYFPGPRDIAFRDARAAALHAAGRTDAAVSSLQHTLRLYRGHALGHYRLGRIYDLAGRVDTAQNEYEAFLELWSQAAEHLPQVVDAHQRLAVIRSQP